MPDFADPSVRDGALDWAAGQLAGRNRGPIVASEQPHAAPWGTVLRLETADGPLWLKASTPALAHEGDVIALLAARRPDLVPVLVAHDAERGLMLQEDAGTRLRELRGDDPALPRWLELLPRYAELQLAVAADRDALVAAGAPDRGDAPAPAGGGARGRGAAAPQRRGPRRRGARPAAPARAPGR